jgi:hypothetical protein
MIPLLANSCWPGRGFPFLEKMRCRFFKTPTEKRS